MKINIRTLLVIILLNLPFLKSMGQTPYLDSMKAIYDSGRKDTATINVLNNIARAFLNIDNCDSGLLWARKAIGMGNELNFKPGIAQAKVRAGIALRCMNDFAAAYLMLQEAKALAYELKNDQLAIRSLRNIGSIFKQQDKRADAVESFFEAVSLSEKIKDTFEEISNLSQISDIFYDEGKYEKALEYSKRIEHLAEAPNFQYIRDVITESLGYIYKALNNDSLSIYYQLQSLQISEQKKDTLGIANSYIQLGDFHESRARYNLAIDYFIKAEPMYRIIKDTGGLADSYFRRAAVYLVTGKTDSALLSYKESMRLAGYQDDNYVVSDNLLQIGKVYMKIQQYAKALAYLKDNLSQALKLEKLPRIADAYYHLSQVYDKLNQKGEALNNMRQYALIKDSINIINQSDNVVALEAKVKFEKTVQETKAQQEKDKLQASIKIYSLMGGLALLLLLAALLYRNNKQKQNAKTKIEKAYEKLKLTQTQLIQSEKMASLGELTAGIAHEIQNPLNFVNNFSEINMELIDEMQNELKTGNHDEAIEISNDIKENQEKINQHGKRADAIVKGMLQHSRSSSGVREPTDINALAEEYLRLAYHGLRAKDKSFNVQLKTDFDTSIGRVNIIPQDIGRVILNLFTNAFYSVSEKAKQSTQEYEPTVYISTKKINDRVEVRVKDNGGGIPPKVLDKIFQPFFTTKPTGQGTGLGLSLSYDIITAHGGELKVESIHAEGASFIIRLPIKEII